MTQKEFVQWLCSGTSRIDAAEAAEIFKQLKAASPEMKLKLIQALSK